MEAQGAEDKLGQQFVFCNGANVGRSAQVGNLNEFAVGGDKDFRLGHLEPVHQGEDIIHISLGKLYGVRLGGGDDIIAYVLDGFINVVVVLGITSVARVKFWEKSGASGA